MEQAMFAAGCFWGVEHRFRKVNGVINIEVGYSGGTFPDPTYPQVCTGRTGHAEVALIEFDPDILGYDELLDRFWEMHDPTTRNRQGPDVGTQYRSAIFYFSQEQRDMAMDSMRRQALKRGKAIVTEISPAGTFWPAEEYHQRYFEKNPGVG